MQVQETGARTAAQILVAAADGKVDVVPDDVDRQRAERMVDVEQQPPPAACVAPTSAATSSSRCPVLKTTSETTTRSARRADRGHDVVVLEAAVAHAPRRTTARCARAVHTRAGSRRSNRTRRATRRRAGRPRRRTCSGSRAVPDRRWSSARRNRRPVRPAVARAGRDTPRSRPSTRPTRRPCGRTTRASPSRTSSSIASSGRPSEWLAR